MLLKKKNILFICGIALLTFAMGSCGDDDPMTDDVVVVDDGPDPIDDEPDPNGLLGEIDFIKTYGGSNIDEANDVVQADDGGFVLFGTTTSTNGDITDKTTDDLDFWVLKLNADGSKDWSKTYGGSDSEVGYGISKTSDGGYILSGYSRSFGGNSCGNDGDVCENDGFQDFWIAKINGTGDLLWEQNYGFAGGEQCYKVIETADGGYFATGFLDVTLSNGEGNDGLLGSSPNSRGGSRHGVGEFWGIKMDSNGNKIWRRYFGGESNDRSFDALETDDGGFLMVGSSESEQFDITDPKGTYDMWVVKVSASGDKLWTKSFGGSEIDVAYKIAPAGNGDYILVGDTRSGDQDVSNPLGNADLWVVKFSGSNGNMIWERTYGGTQFESAQSITAMSGDMFAIAGSSRSSDGDVAANNGQNDIWVLVIDANGIPQFELNVGGSDLDFGNEVIATTDGKLLVVGETDSNDGDISQFQGVKDLVVIKIK